MTLCADGGRSTLAAAAAREAFLDGSWDATGCCSTTSTKSRRRRRLPYVDSW
jgi:hypothetical protein